MQSCFRTVMALLVTLLVGPTLAAQPLPARIPEDAVSDARELAFSGRRGDAFHLLEAHLEADPDDTEARTLAGFTSDSSLKAGCLQPRVFRGVWPRQQQCRSHDASGGRSTEQAVGVLVRPRCHGLPQMQPRAAVGRAAPSRALVPGQSDVADHVAIALAGVGPRAAMRGRWSSIVNVELAELVRPVRIGPIMSLTAHGTRLAAQLRPARRSISTSGHRSAMWNLSREKDALEAGRTEHRSRPAWLSSGAGRRCRERNGATSLRLTCPEGHPIGDRRHTITEPTTTHGWRHAAGHCGILTRQPPGDRLPEPLLLRTPRYRRPARRTHRRSTRPV